MATVTVRFFGPARDLAGTAEQSFEIEPGLTLGLLAGRIAERVPALANTQGLRLAVNRAYVPLDRVLSPNDEIAVIPPVSGGSYPSDVVLTREPIDVAKYLSFLTSPESGAIASFVGVVRKDSKAGTPLVALDYHAYEEMALDQMRQIRDRAVERFDLLDACLVHRLGSVALTEPSILVCVTSAHRAESFDAVRWIVDAIKNDVPIWKKDVWADQSTSWVAQ